MYFGLLHFFYGHRIKVTESKKRFALHTSFVMNLPTLYFLFHIRHEWWGKQFPSQWGFWYKNRVK